MGSNNGNSPATAFSETAFNPHSGEHEVVCQHEGLTKRETFAMAAMQGLISSASDQDGTWAFGDKNDMANYSVEIADALLAALDKGE